MTKHPPHLPPRTVTLGFRRRAESLAWFLFIIVVTSITSIAAALATVAWIAPNYIPFTTSVSVGGKKAASLPLPADIAQNTPLRMLTLYDTRLLFDNTFSAPGAKKGESILFHPDGWAVTASSVAAGEEKFFVGVTSVGKQYLIEKTLVDKASGLTFIKFKGEGFRIVSFALMQDLPSSSHVWVFSSGEWMERVVKNTLIETKEPYPLARPPYQFLLNEPAATGSTVFTAEGDFFGFVQNNNTVAASSFIPWLLPSLLTQGKILHETVPMQGYFVEQMPLVEKLRDGASGFYIAKTSGADLKAGDIILDIERAPLDLFAVEEQILRAPVDMTLRILRNGVEKDIIVHKVPLVL